MAYVKADAWVLQQIAATGLPLVGGSVSAYITGTTTPLAMYTDSAGSGSATSFTLNSLGMPQSAGGTAVDIYLDDAYVYKFIIRDSGGSAVGPTIDPVYPGGGNGLTGTMTSMEALRASSVSVDYIETVAFYEDGATGGAKLYRDGTGTPTGSGAAVIAAALAAGTFCNAAGVCYKLISGQPITPYIFGAILGADCSISIQSCIEYVGLTLGGGIITGYNHEFLVNDANLTVEYDDVGFAFIKFKRTSTTTGFILSYGSTVDVSGGGVINAKFTGLATVAGGNGGLLMGTDTYRASSYVLDNIVATGFSQYGVGIEGGDNWTVSNIRVLEHGLTSGTISSCIGFYVFPRIASYGGQLSNIYSQISDACVANASANTAAIKLQAHQKLAANNITSVYGREESMVIDSIDGTISDVTVYQQDTRPGLVVTNYNAVHSFSGQEFTLDGFEIKHGGSSNTNEFVISASVDGQYSLTGCTLRNGKGGGSTFLNYSVVKDCTFENLDFEDIRWSTAYLGFSVNSVASTGNTFRAVSARGGGMTGTLVIEASDSTLVDVGLSSVTGDTVSTFELYGNDNLIFAPYVHNCGTNAIKVTGDSNQFHDVALKDITGRSIWFPSGSDNNQVHSGNMWEGTGVLDSGSGNYINGQRRVFYRSAAPTAGTWAVGDTVYNTAPAAAGTIGWVCTTAGAPGTWKTFGTIAA